MKTGSKNRSQNFSQYPLLWLSVFFAFGIFIAGNYSIQLSVCLTISLISVVLCIVFLKTRQIAVIILFVSFTAIGGLFFQIEKETIPANRLKNLYDNAQINSGDPIEIEGVLKTAPELAPDGFFLEIQTEKAIYKDKNIEIPGKVSFFAPISSGEIAEDYKNLNLQYGSKIRVACRLSRENDYLNPGVFLRKEILDIKDTDVSGTIKSPLLIEKIGETETFTPLDAIYEYRQELILDFINYFNPKTAGVLIASLLGNRNFLDKETAEIFREGGTFHVLVISGLHITFIGGILLVLTGFFRRKKLWKFFFAVGFLWCYAVAVGAEVPVIRAALMFTILLIPQMISRAGTSLNALGACALTLLVWRPDDLFNPSFHLTFISVGSIVVTAFPLIEKLRKIGSWSPSAETPFPPDVPKNLRSFCETLYWRETAWEVEGARQIWSAKLFKTPYFKLKKRMSLQRILQYIFEAILITCVVQIWLLPLLIIYFHRVTFSSIFLNIWVGIFIALESFSAIFAVFLAQFNAASALPFAEITNLLNWFLLSFPKLFVANDLASFRLPVYSGNFKVIYVFYFFPLLVLAILLNKWKPEENFKMQISNFKTISTKIILKIASLTLIIFFSIIVFHPFSAPFSDGRLHVDFLDVGQGDSAFITFPNGETMLVDGGGKVNFAEVSAENEGAEVFKPDTQSIGESVVSAFLWERGYSKIDYILATHADADHIQGLTDVAKNFKVRAAFFGRTPFDDSDFNELFAVLEKHKIEIKKIGSGDFLEIGATEVEVLNPLKEETNTAISANNNSVVLRLVFGERKFLLTGDIEKEAEKYLLQTPELIICDVVKVAHHGSRTSSVQEFIDASRAEYAIIPVGKRSRFGHPHAEVVKRWINSGAKVSTTGENGTIFISTDGKDLKIESFAK